MANGRSANGTGRIPSIGPAEIELLERLSNAVAVSGDEGAVRKIVLQEIEGLADEVRTDALGNVLAVRRGEGERRLRVMVAAHMDEVGLMLTHDEGDGFFRIDKVGGVDERTLVGKPVLAGSKQTPGVIGAKPIHLSNASEWKQKVPLDGLRLDVGPGNGQKVKVGDRAAFATRFRVLGPSLLGKALDDRLGVAALILLLKNPPPNIDLLAAFTVQEEVGLRGARVAAYVLKPDLALVLDAVPAYDLPAHDETENSTYNTRLGAGPAIYIADRRTLSDPRLIRHLAATAEAHAIPYQFRQPGGGGTDAGSIHLQRGGIPSVSMSVPARYLHTAASLARRSDWENTVALAYRALADLPEDILQQPRP